MGGSASRESDTDGTQFRAPSQTEPAVSCQRVRAGLGAGSLVADKYRLERLLGEGGMGAVWRAHHLQLDLPVAIKLLLGDRNDTMLFGRLKIEARAAARLVHPNIARVFDIDATAEGDPFIVMEFLNGESLGDVLDRGPLPAERAVQIMLPIADALTLAHAKGIVHRDLKPDNVFLATGDDGLQPKLLDFGVAKVMSAPLPDGGLTETGILVGSPDYMSPEQARGRDDLDHRADIWSFCVLLYEAVTGVAPFSGGNYNALMNAILEDAPRPLDEHVDQRLAALILAGLSKDRALRPGSIRELGCALSQWLLERGVTVDVCGTSLETKWSARASSPTLTRLELPVKGRPWLLLAAALALTGGLAWAVSGSTSPAATTPAKPDHAVALLPQSAPTSVATTADATIKIAATPAAPAAASGNSESRTRFVAPPAKATPKGKLPAPAAQPAREVHGDEAGELLQAY
jgi:predicted Ser/Thr protein kinase